MASTKLAMLVNNLVDHPVFLGLLGIHNKIALDVFFNAADRLAAMLRQKFIDHRAHAQDFLGVQIDIGGLAAQTRHPRLVNQDARVGQRKTLFRRAAGKKYGGDGSSLADASGDYVGLDELHGVVNCEARGDGAARRIDVQLNVFFGVFGLKKEHLCGGQVGDVVVNRRANKDDVLFEQPRIDIVSALAAAGLFDHHGYKSGAAIFRIFEVFHWLADASAAAAVVLIFAFWANQSRVLSLRNFAFILSSVPCFVKRARIASADSLLWPARCSSSCSTSSSVTSIFSAVAMRSTMSSALTSSLARSSLRFLSETQSIFTARGSTPCCARERTTRSRRTSI